MTDELRDILIAFLEQHNLEGGLSPQAAHDLALNGTETIWPFIAKAVAVERERCVRIIRDACFRGLGNRPEPTWQNIIEAIESEA